MADDMDDEDLQAAIVMSLQTEETEVSNKPTLTTNSCPQPEDYSVTSFHKIMWDPQTISSSDQRRWISQGIHIPSSQEDAPREDPSSSSILDRITAGHLPWGLQQQHGGPCGVLAAVQAEMLRFLLFGMDYPSRPVETASSATPTSALTPEKVQMALIRAISLIIARSALIPVAYEEQQQHSSESAPLTPRVASVVLPSPTISSVGLTWNLLEPWNDMDSLLTENASASASRPAMTTNAFVAYKFPCGDEDSTAPEPKRQRFQLTETLHPQLVSLAKQIQSFLECDDRISHFQRDGGVLLLTMSVIASRSSPVIQHEFDDTIGTRLTAQFGHCSQELMNLLLTGQAVSNVFDRTMRPSGDMVCRGIQNQSSVGYLSQLESLRYCEVGTFYKSPVFPIWVVGSTSHFTVMFGGMDALQESKSDLLLDECRRAFKTVEGGAENGFISTAKFKSVLDEIGLNLSDSESQTLSASIEVSGAGIILWDAFWRVVSRLKTGASLEQVLAVSASGGDGIPADLPDLIRVDDTTDRSFAPASTETDEEMAHRLAREWSAETTAENPAQFEFPPAAPSDQGNAGMSDEELARKLQAEWNETALAAYAGASSSVGDISSTCGVATGSVAGHQFLNENDDDQKPAVATNNAANSGASFEKYGQSFDLFHYNGLRGGTLTKLKVTRLTPEEAVGASIALNAGGGRSGSGDLEDVVRTKWPSCMINWLGKSAPFID